jgi:hypothetical protein
MKPDHGPWSIEQAGSLCPDLERAPHSAAHNRSGHSRTLRQNPPKTQQTKENGSKHKMREA